MNINPKKTILNSMPFSFSSYGPLAILAMIGILSIAELIKYLRAGRHNPHKKA